MRPTAMFPVALATLSLPASVTAKPPPITFERPAPVVQTVQLPPPPSEAYGDWEVISINTGAYMAAIKNNAGNAFGTLCFEEKCYSFFDTGIDCDEGSHYPALINAPGGSYSVNLLCEKVGKSKLYSTPLESSMSEAMSIGGVLGIAFPMQSGEFKVARFSLTGAARASARASQLASGRAHTDQQAASDNQTL